MILAHKKEQIEVFQPKNDYDYRMIGFWKMREKQILNISLSLKCLKKYFFPLNFQTFVNKFGSLKDQKAFSCTCSER